MPRYHSRGLQGNWDNENLASTITAVSSGMPQLVLHVGFLEEL